MFSLFIDMLTYIVTFPFSRFCVNELENKIQNNKATFRNYYRKNIQTEMMTTTTKTPHKNSNLFTAMHIAAYILFPGY